MLDDAKNIFSLSIRFTSLETIPCSNYFWTTSHVRYIIHPYIDRIPPSSRQSWTLLSAIHIGGTAPSHHNSSRYGDGNRNTVPVVRLIRSTVASHNPVLTCRDGCMIKCDILQRLAAGAAVAGQYDKGEQWEFQKTAVQELRKLYDYRTLSPQNVVACWEIDRQTGRDACVSLVKPGSLDSNHAHANNDGRLDRGAGG